MCHGHETAMKPPRVTAQERMALLAQTEQLRLSIYDEHDYRDKVTAPPPSLSAMHELKRQLQHCLELHDHTAGAPVRAATPRRGALSRYTPLPDVL